MKKLLVSANVILASLLAALGFQSCNREASNVEEKKPDTVVRPPRPGEIRLMYGVNPVPFRKLEVEEPAKDE